jgi:hypothetical protein
VLREHEAGVKLPELRRKHRISDATFYNWKAKYRKWCSAATLLDDGVSADGSAFLKSRKAYSHDDVM